MTTPLRCAIRKAVYLVLSALGVVVSWYAAPDLEAEFFPILTDVHLVPFSPDRPDVLVERQLDRVCWRQHIHKLRLGATRRWSVTIILPNGDRFFSAPIDGRTGVLFSSKDVYDAGFDGEVPLCALLPEDLDASQAFRIESIGQYEVPHHLWIVEQRPPVIIDVPAAIGGGQ